MAQDPAHKKQRAPLRFRLPEDVEILLPKVAEREGVTSAHAYGVEAIANRVRRAAKRHGLTTAEG